MEIKQEFGCKQNFNRKGPMKTVSIFCAGQTQDPLCSLLESKEGFTSDGSTDS